MPQQPADRIAGAFDVLPPPSPTDDVTLLLEDRARRVNRDAALDRLYRTAEPAQSRAAQTAPATPDATAQASEPQRAGMPPVRYIGEFWRRSKAVAADVAMGVPEAPLQVVGGARDAAQAMIDLGASIKDALPKPVQQAVTMAETVLSPGPKMLEQAIKFFDKEQSDKTGIQLPEIGEADTVTGGLVRGVSQFLTGFALGGAALRTAGIGAATTTGGRFVQASAQGAFSDVAAFDEHQARLSDLVQQVPALQNPVSAYLASDPEDSTAEGRFKNALEGLGLGALTEAFVRGVRGIRALRADRAATMGDTAAQEAGESVLRGARADLLGDPDAPLTTRRRRSARSVVEDAARQTEGVQPEDIAPRGMTEIGDSEVFVNFARIETADDIKTVIRNAANSMKGSIDEARRGVRTHGQTRLAANEVNAWDTLLKRRTGEALNAEQTLAARELWVASGDKLTEAAEAAYRDPSAENLFQFRRMMTLHHAIQKEVIAARTETARALNQWKIPAGGSSEQMAQLERALNMAGGTETSRELAKAVLAASRMGGRGAVSALAEKGAYAITRDAVLEYWVNALLSGPKTHMVNMISNASVIGLSMAEHATAAQIGRLLGSADGVAVGEAMAQAHGIKTAFREALGNAAKTFRTGETGFGIRQIEGTPERAISSGAWNMRTGTPQARAVDMLGAVATTPGRALLAEDEFFKTIGYRMALHAHAFRRAQRAVQSGEIRANQAKGFMADIVENPPEELRMEAAAYAAYQTFTTEPGPLVRKINAIRHKAPLFRFVVPFLNTPANIFKYTMERTPLAPVTARYKAAIAKGGAEADLARSRMALGSMAILTALDLAMDGHITGSGPDKQTEREHLFRSRWKPYSVRVGDKYVAFNRFDPIGNLLQFGGDLGEALVNIQDQDYDSQVAFERAMSASVFAAAEALNSKAALTGLSDIIEALNEPDRRGPRYLARLAASFVPTAVRETATAMDPTARATASIIDEFKSRIPGFRDGLPARRDYWGREIRYESGIGALYDTVSPLYGSTFKREPIDAELERLGWFPGMPTKAFNVIPNVRVNFSDRPDIYSRFLELRGQTRPSQMNGGALIDLYGDVPMLDALNDIVEGRGGQAAEYAALENDEDKEKFLDRVVDRYRAVAKEKLIDEFPVLMERAERNATRKRRLTVPLPE